MVSTTLPLCTAVVEPDAYQLYDFKNAFRLSGENRCYDPSPAEFIDGLTYDDKDYFTIEETRFLLQIVDPVTLSQMNNSKPIEKRCLGKPGRGGIC
jgi:hypothetical protein